MLTSSKKKKPSQKHLESWLTKYLDTVSQPSRHIKLTIVGLCQCFLNTGVQKKWVTRNGQTIFRHVKRNSSANCAFEKHKLLRETPVLFNTG